MTRLVGLFFALACLLGCGGEPVAVQRGAALQPPIACCVPRPLPYAYVCSSTATPAWGQVRVCSSAAPFYPNPVCAMQTAAAPDTNLASYGWSVNGWHVYSILLDEHAGVGLFGAFGSLFTGGPWSGTFTAADGVDYMTQWAL